MNRRACEEAPWIGDTTVTRRLQEAGHHLARLLAWWRDPPGERVGDGADRHAAGTTARAFRSGAAAATRERPGAARTEVEELIRQEHAKLVQTVFLAPGSKRRVVLFAGVGRDNGCAGLCLRSAQTLARLTPHPVCVVDASLRSPALHRLAGVDGCRGLAAAIDRPDVAPTFAVPLTPGNLWLLPSGSPSDPDRLLAVERVRACLQELRARFHHVIISTPPMDLYAESLALSQLVDGVLLVLEAHVTRRETVRNAKTRLEELDVPFLGVVLNNRTFPIPESLYRLI